MVGSKPKTPYLRQRMTNRIYIWTDAQAKRDDMIPMTKEEHDDYLSRGVIGVSDDELERLGRREAEDETFDLDVDEGEGSHVHDEIKGEATDGENKEAAYVGDADSHPDMALIDEFETKNQVEEYMLRKFKIEIDRRMSIENLKKQARKQLKAFLKDRKNRGS